MLSRAVLCCLTASMSTLGGKLRKWLQTKSVNYKISQKLDHKKLLEHEKGLQLRLIGDGSTTVTTLYRSIKVGYEPEAYLRAVKSYRLRTVLSRSRCGQHGLEVQLGRQAQVYVPREDRKCKVCHQECEHHFLFLCPLYADNVRSIPTCSEIWLVVHCEYS